MALVFLCARTTAGADCTQEGQVTSHTYAPIVSGFLCTPAVNDQYTYKDQYSGIDRYENSNGIWLMKTDVWRSAWHGVVGQPNTWNTYYFQNSQNTDIPGKTPQTPDSSYQAVNAGGIPSDLVEICASGHYTRTGAFDPNPVSILCVCDKGWTPVHGACQKCIAGKYKGWIGRTACTDCPANSHSLIGSADDCFCNAGYTATGSGNTWGFGVTCTACPADTYKPASGNAACSQCPVPSISFSGSTACMCGPWGTSNEVALLHSTAQFESRQNRFSTPVLPDTPRFEKNGGPGPSGRGTSAVVFNSASDLLNAGSLSMDIGTNGFTAVAVVKFTAVVEWQRIFEFGPIDDNLNNVFVIRQGTGTSLRFVIRNGPHLCYAVSDACIVEDTWQILVAQYNASNSVITVRMGDTFGAWQCSAPRHDRTFAKMILGGNPIKIAGFYAVDKLLSTQEVSAITDNIYLDKDLFDAWCALPSCEPGYSVDMLTKTCTCNAGYTGTLAGTCTLCSADTYKPDGTAECLQCPQFSYSNRLASVYLTDIAGVEWLHGGRSARTSCACTAGYTGEFGGTCTACGAGTYKPASGSTQCIDCPQFSNVLTTGSPDRETYGQAQGRSGGHQGSSRNRRCQLSFVGRL